MFQLHQTRSRASTRLSFLSPQSGFFVIALVDLHTLKCFLNLEKLDFHKLNAGTVFPALIVTACDSSTKIIGFILLYVSLPRKESELMSMRSR